MGKKRQRLAKKLLHFVRSLSEWGVDEPYPDAANYNDKERMREEQWERLRWIVFCL